MTRITVIWDSMIDKYIYWNTDRKNPESPMPLLQVEKEEIKLWWASNVANNIAKLNWWVDLISMIWEDSNWVLLTDLCEKEKINLIALFTNAPTITKTRYLDSQYKQQLLRVDYEKKEKITKDNIDKIINILETQKPSYILISDYNKWIVTPEMMQSIKEYADKNDIKILADIKPSNVDLFQWVYVIKPNFKEFCEMMWIQWIENIDENIEKYWLEFVKKYKTNLVVTRWWKWSTLITIDWNVHHIPAEERKVFDVTLLKYFIKWF